MRGAVYGVSASDPLSLAAVPVALLAVALAASWIPARRAARVDPATVVRGE
jgi:ABC-type lipoprotein release transport system permease subunit